MAVAATDFDDLFRREYRRVLRAVHWTLGHGDIGVAEEITQEAFCRALERWARVRRHENPGGWVQLTALRLAIRTDTRRRRSAAVDLGWPQTTDLREVDIDLERAILSLSRQQRLAVVLHHLLDLPIVEVASVMGVREGTVKTHLHRGRRQLADALGEDEEVSDAAR